VRASIAAALAMVSALVVIAPAGAGPAGGATYRGALPPGGGAVEFTVNAAGTSLTTYLFTDITGTDANGHECTFLAQGKEGFWPGADIVDNAFSYKLGTESVVFTGMFAPDRSASGTIEMTNPAHDGYPGCKSGARHWTAKPTSASAPDPPSNGGGGGSDPAPGGGPGSSPTKTPATAKKAATFRTTITLRKRPTRLTGRVASRGLGCTVVRLITLKHGTKNVALTATSKTGAFSFKRPKRLHGRVRARVSARPSPQGTCAAATSKALKL